MARWFILMGQCVEETQSTFIMGGNFNLCEEQQSMPIQNPNTKYCRNETICTRGFKLSYINIMPYYKMRYLLDTTFNICCGQGAKTVTVHSFNDDSKVLLLQLVASNTLVRPLIVMTILLSGVTGFVAWSMETCRSEREFPHSFFTGISEGFWWTFVCMIRVGCGDRLQSYGYSWV